MQQRKPMQTKKGFILFTVLIFLQLSTALGLAAMLASARHMKLLQQELQAANSQAAKPLQLFTIPPPPAITVSNKTALNPKQEAKT